MEMDNKKRTCLSISKEAKVKLDEIKHTGQSYDGIIQELLMYWKKQQETKEAVR
jgi:predicted CopG family antitoxin